MARSARFNDYSNKFLAGVAVAQHNALLEAGRDLLVLSKSRAPFKDGGLRRESDVKIVTQRAVLVRYWVEYATYQERGARRDGSRKVRKYTTSGTGAHFLENAGNTIRSKMGSIYKKHLRKVM